MSQARAQLGFDPSFQAEPEASLRLKLSFEPSRALKALHKKLKPQAGLSSSVLSAQQNAHCYLYACCHRTLHSTHCTVHSAHCTLHTATAHCNCTLFSLGTLYTIPCTSLHWTEHWANWNIAKLLHLHCHYISYGSVKLVLKGSSG